MPKLVRARVAWSRTFQKYLTEETGADESFEIAPEGPAWYKWLDQISSFAFWGKSVHYTARKEHRPHGEGYWYAYLSANKKLSKRYLGKTSDLTLMRLEEVASELLARSGQEVTVRQERRGAPAHRGAHASVARAREDEGREASPPSIERSDMQELADPLLVSKLRIPQPRASRVPRPQLVERLQRGMECPLTLLSAPAGFGKTTLLAEWLAQSGTAATWLALEPEDNEPMRFFSCVLAALQRLYPAIGNGTRILLHAPHPPPLELVLALVANELLASTTEDVALVLDDYHVIEAEAIHRGMTFLLDHLPPQMHLILATRADPALPLARLRARGQLVEVRAADLRFDDSETAAFLQTVMGIGLSASDVALLAQRTEGWIAGLQLAALSLRGRTDTTQFLAAFTGSHRFVLDYLSEEVFPGSRSRCNSFCSRPRSWSG